MSGRVHILGTHGVPAAYGGFETAAQEVGRYLAAHGWDVHVYCQVDGHGPVSTDRWEDLTRVLVPEHRAGWLGTASFDLTCIRHVLRTAGPDDVLLTFGYNTGVLDLAPRLRRLPNVVNMDGMEWTRRRWGLLKQGILLANERLAGLFGDVLVGDHPVISRYLERHFGARRVVTITYGAYAVDEAPTAPVTDLGLRPGDYATMICRPIPENSCLEIVRAWSARPRGQVLAVLGDYDGTGYAEQVRAAASAEVRFLGAVYDPAVTGALRRHCTAYLHGHTVGGTNPSLVEAMAAGNPVFAHDNAYNAWVAGPQAGYFRTEEDLDALLTARLTDPAALATMGTASRDRHSAEFTWERIGGQYAAALETARATHQQHKESVS